MVVTDEEIGGFDGSKKLLGEAGYKPKEQVSIAIDPASSEFYDKEKKVYVEMKKKKAKQSYKTFHKQHIKELYNPRIIA